MSAESLQALANVGKGESTRTLLRVVILFLIAGAAIASRLFSVIRKSCLGRSKGAGEGRLMRAAISFDAVPYEI